MGNIDEEFEGLTDAASAEPTPVADAASPLAERLRAIHGHSRGSIPAPDPSVISPDSSLAKLGSLLGTYAGSGEITDDAMTDFYRQLSEEGAIADLPAPSSTYKNARHPTAALHEDGPKRHWHRDPVHDLLHGTHSQTPPVPEPILDIPLGKICTTEFPNMRIDEEPDTAALEASMTTLRQFAPVIVCRDKMDPENKFHLISGHIRYKAAQRLHWPTIKAIVRAVRSAVEAVLINTLENVARNDPSTYEVANRCEELIRQHHMDIGDVARLFGKSVSYIYLLIRLLTSLPANALADWRHRHPAATLPHLEAILKEFNSGAAWERMRAKHERDENKASVPPAPVGEEDDSGDVSGWGEFKRPSKATLRRVRDAIARAKLPSDPEAVREMLTGFCDWARGATARIPYLVTPPPKRQRPRQRPEPR